MDTNLLILLIVVLFVILLAGGFVLFRQEASGEIKAGPLSFLFRGRNARKTAPGHPPAHTRVDGVKVGGSGEVVNRTGQPTSVTNSTFGDDLTVRSENPPAAAAPQHKTSKATAQPPDEDAG